MQPDRAPLTPERCKDAGLALVLVCLLAYQAWKTPALVLAAVVFLLVAMTCPVLFKPFARFWFWLSTALGTVMSKVILSALFFGLVLPVGLVRRLMGKDGMRRRCWKKGTDSVFQVRAHRFEPSDLEHPY